MNYKKTFIVFIILPFVLFELKAQTFRIIIVNSTPINCLFNTITKYENGITLTDYTTIAIEASGFGATGWQFEFDADGPIEGSVAPDDLNLAVVRLRAVRALLIGPITTAIFEPGFVELKMVPSPLITNGTNGTDAENVFKISYDIGVGTTVKNLDADTYTGKIRFILSSE